MTCPNSDDASNTGEVMDISETERDLHRRFILRHVDTLTKVLAAENFQAQHRSPCGCPRSTPAEIAHRRGANRDPWDCVYQNIGTLDRTGHNCKTGCKCGDPLASSDDPLDSVAAAVLAERDGVRERYFDHRERELVATFRNQIGDWEAISCLDVDKLKTISNNTDNRYTVSRERLARLSRALDVLSSSEWTESVTLCEVPRVSYSNLQEKLAELPGLSEQESWWLVLAALDKPVWPASPEIDRLLVEFGILSPDDLGANVARREQLETELTPRQILPLHRGLAAHSRHCGGDHSTATCEIRKFTLSYRKQQQRTASDGPVVIDLFAGAGGLSYGFGETDCRVGFATDRDQYAMDTYRLNHPGIPHQQIRCSDINDLVDDPDFADYLPDDVDILVGGPPCQALSVAGYRSRLADNEDYSVVDDPRTELYQQYVNVLEKVNPTFLVIENVQGIHSEIGDTDRRVIDDVRAELDEAGYSSESRLLDCSRFGIPQHRDRVFVFGVNQMVFDDAQQVARDLFERLEANYSQDAPSIRQALANLPRLRRGQGSNVVVGQNAGRPSDYVRTHEIGKGTVLTYNHRAREHPMERDRTLFDEVMEPGDTGWDVKYRKGRDDLIEYDVGTEKKPQFKDKYRMLDWTQPSPTIVAHLQKDANSFILPDYYQYVCKDSVKADDRRNRGITPREAARLQSFPDSYFFLGPFTSQFQQIGNAVPPVAGKAIAQALVQNITGSSVQVGSNKDTIISQSAPTDD